MKQVQFFQCSVCVPKFQDQPCTVSGQHALYPKCPWPARGQTDSFDRLVPEPYEDEPCDDDNDHEPCDGRNERD